MNALRIILVCLLATVSVSCRRQATPTSQPLKPLRVVCSDGGAHFKAWQARFETDNPGWTLQRVGVSQSGAKAFYYSAGIDGTMPDVVELFDLTQWLAGEGYLAPLPDAFYEQYGLPLPQAYRGRRYGTGSPVGLLGLAVNRSLWKSAGLTGVPQTWAELAKSLETIDAHLLREGLSQQGYRAIAWGGRDWSARLPLELALRVEVLDRNADGISWARRRTEKKVSFTDSTEAAGAVKAVRDAIGPRVDKQAMTMTYADQQALFTSGRAAAWFTGTWTGRELELAGAEFDVGFYGVPSVTGPAKFVSTTSAAGGWSISSSAAGERGEMAAKAIAALYSPEVYQAYLDSTGSLGRAEKVPATVPACRHRSAAAFYASAREMSGRVGVTAPAAIRSEDLPPAAFVMSLAPLSRSMLQPGSAQTLPDTPTFLKELDSQWDAANRDPVE